MVAKEIGLDLELKWVINQDYLFIRNWISFVIKLQNISIDYFCAFFYSPFREVDFINSEHMSEGFTKVELGID